jgi:hypothetical protein
MTKPNERCADDATHGNAPTPPGEKNEDGKKCHEAPPPDASKVAKDQAAPPRRMMLGLY